MSAMCPNALQCDGSWPSPINDIDGYKLSHLSGGNPSLSPSRYKWVTFEISWFLLVNPNSLTAWLSSVCILDRLLIGGEQKPIPKYQQPRVFLGLFSHLIKQKPFSKYLWVFYASSSDNPVYLGKVFGQDSRVAFMPVQENLILEFYIDSKFVSW